MNFIDQFNEEAKELEKHALVERLVRLGATDVERLPGVRRLVKSTPRLFMRERSPGELKALQRGVERQFRKVEAPLERKLHKVTARLPGAVKKPVRKGGKLLIRNPEQIALQPVPVPGASMAATGVKKGLEKVIDKLAPV
jgi:hypothetical protein